MIIPHGLTVNIGLREYKEGEQLPHNAPEAVKKQVNDYIAKHATGKTQAEKRKTLEEKAAKLKLGVPEEITKLSDADLEALIKKTEEEK